MSIRIALAQINATVGDLLGNRALIRRYIDDAEQAGADIVAFPELAMTGYPPEDLLLKKGFIDDNIAAIHSLAEEIQGIGAIVGFVDKDEHHIYNSAALIQNGEVRAIYHKQLLPNYGVFDEQRYFESGDGLLLATIGDLTFGITVCEDLWRADGPHAGCAAAGASLIININASPYHMGKGTERAELLKTRVKENGTAFAYVNLVGGQDELIFDGQSVAVDADGELLARATQYEEELLVFDLPVPSKSPKKSRGGGEEALNIVALGDSRPKGEKLAPRIAPVQGETEEAYSALVLGVRDYLGKNGFTHAIVGISGGIDSALTAAVAVDALGAQRVLGISNPSEYTSSRSEEDAAALANNLGFELLTIPIKDPFEALLKALDPVFSGTEPGIAEENLQARIRGMLWMAISNKTGRIVLSTGNKSEMAVGYATLYGDMAGGFAVLKDVPKTLVYELASWRNSRGAVIPSSIIERPPTAELRPDQFDTDSLPPYDVLDPILEAYVEDDLSINEIAARGFDIEVVKRVARMVDLAEYKRRQAPPGIKITDRAFGKDRRLPITNRYRPYL